MSGVCEVVTTVILREMEVEMLAGLTVVTSVRRVSRLD